MTLKREKPSNYFAHTAHFLIVGGLVSLSGFCSLVYQVVWERALKYNFGGDSVSSAIITATFLLGLGIGALLFGRWRKNAFPVYSIVEFCIGIYAIASYYILATLATTLGRFFNYSINDVGELRLLVVWGSILFLLPPCILMGGTLPLVFNCFVPPGLYSNKTVGLLYGLNTIGAAFGVLAVPFVFLNHISLPSTLLTVGAINILLGLGVWLYGRAVSSPTGQHVKESETDYSTAAAPLPFLPLLSLSFITGFICLSFEVSLFRTVGLLTNSSPYTFPLVLMPFLAALSLGSIVFTRFKNYNYERAFKRVGLLLVIAMLGMLSSVVVRYSAPATIGLLVMMIVPLPLFLGGVFPIVLRLASGQGRELPAKTGKLYLVNSIGAFLGAMGSQFYGFPLLGTRWVIVFLYVLGVTAGTLCLIIADKRSSHRLKYAPIVIGLLALAFLLPPAAWDVYTFKYIGADVDRREGVSGVATVNWAVKTPGAAVEVNGTYMSALPDHPNHVRIAGIALSLPHRQRVALLGLGGGGLVRELAADAAIEQIDVIDWSHELYAVLQLPRPAESLSNVLRNPKVRFFPADARVAVSLYEDHAFDMVIDNLTVMGWAGSTSVKSVSYFREVSRIIKPDGVFLFAPHYTHTLAREAVLAGLLENFEYVEEHGQARVVLASHQPVEIDPAQADAALKHRGEILGLPKPYTTWLIKGFQPVSPRDLNNTPPVRDELLVYEYTLFGNLHTSPLEQVTFAFAE